MESVTKETITSRGRNIDDVVNAPDQPQATIYQTLEYLTYFFMGAIEVLLAFRLVLKMTGANAVSGFVNFIYTLSSIFVLPYEGIFQQTSAQGAETTATFEPATLIAIMVNIVIAWGIVMLIRVLSGRKQVVE